MPSDDTDETDDIDPDDLYFEYTGDMALPDAYVDAVEEYLTKAAREAYRQMKQQGPTHTPEGDDAE
jgi:hypothetical protein